MQEKVQNPNDENCNSELKTKITCQNQIYPHYSKAFTKEQQFIAHTKSIGSLKIENEKKSSLNTLDSFILSSPKRNEETKYLNEKLNLIAGCEPVYEYEIEKGKSVIGLNDPANIEKHNPEIGNVLIKNCEISNYEAKLNIDGQSNMNESEILKDKVDNNFDLDALYNDILNDSGLGQNYIIPKALDNISPNYVESDKLYSEIFKDLNCNQNTNDAIVGVNNSELCSNDPFYHLLFSDNIVDSNTTKINYLPRVKEEVINKCSVFKAHKRVTNYGFKNWAGISSNESMIIPNRSTKTLKNKNDDPVEISSSDGEESSKCEPYNVLLYPVAGLARWKRLLEIPNKIKIKNQIFYHSDLERLNEGKWLNDKIVNFYFELLSETFTDTYFFNTFSFAKIASAKSQVELKEMYKDMDFSKYTYFVFPIHTPGHWSAVKIQNNFVIGFDSLGKVSSEIIEIIVKFYVSVANPNLSVIPKRIELGMRLPKQTNGDDCGVFCCTSAKYFSTSNEPGMFCAKDIRRIRIQMLHEILAGKIMYF